MTKKYYAIEYWFDEDLHADAIFRFDSDYRKNGFTLVEDLLIEEKQAA